MSTQLKGVQHAPALFSSLPALLPSSAFTHPILPMKSHSEATAELEFEWCGAKVMKLLNEQIKTTNS